MRSRKKPFARVAIRQTQIYTPIIMKAAPTTYEIMNKLGEMSELLDALADQKFRRIVTVVPGHFHKRCTVARRCRRKPKFMIFGDDGKPKMSRLQYSSCSFHLPLAVERLHKRQTRGK